MRTHTNFTGRLGRWSAEHPWRAIGIWLFVVVVCVMGGKAAGTVKLSQAQYGSGSSGKAQLAVAKAFPTRATEQVLVHSHSMTADEAPFRAAVADVVQGVAATGYAVDLRSPYTGGAGGISNDRHSALVQFQIPGSMSKADKEVGTVEAAVAAAARQHPSFTIAEAGDASIDKATNDTLKKDYKRAEQSALPITLLVLLFTFGALVAAVLPIALAMSAVVAAGGLLAVTSHFNPTADASNSIVLLIGLAVGVDYSLFYLKRARQERAAGATPEAALRTAAATSGRTVLISGITVLIAMAGMFVSGSPVFYSVAWASMLVVAIALVGSLTVLPAIMSLLGDRVERGRIPLVSRARRSGGESRIWGAILDKVLRRPLLAALVSAGALISLAVPFLGMHIASPAASDLPPSLPVLKTYDQIQRAFPGSPAPASVVVQARDVTAPAIQAGIGALERAALRSGQMNEPMFEQVSPNRSVAVVSIPLAGSGEDTASVNALHTLRDRVIPATIGKVPGTTVEVAGVTAGTVDFANLMHQRMPFVFLFVLLLAFLLLLVSFRSIVIPIKAIVLNLLSVGAAYGVLVLIFQDGYGQGLLHFHSVHAITSWLPLFMFVVLFGLSMDYHVFILSRIKEAHDHGSDTETAVARGIKSTAGTVTAAAAVMVMVFLTFGSLSEVSMKEAGIGLATAIFLDATVVRIVLLPATMKLLGEKNWYLPRWLGWIPHFAHDQAVEATGVTVPASLPGETAIPVLTPEPLTEVATRSAA